MKSDKWLKLGYIWEVESVRALVGLNYTEGGGGNQGRLRYFCSLELVLGGDQEFCFGHCGFEILDIQVGS